MIFSLINLFLLLIDKKYKNKNFYQKFFSLLIRNKQQISQNNKIASPKNSKSETANSKTAIWIQCTGNPCYHHKRKKKSVNILSKNKAIK